MKRLWHILIAFCDLLCKVDDFIQYWKKRFDDSEPEEPKGKSKR